MPRSERLLVVVSLIIALIGIFVRIHSFGGYSKVGFDEHIYQTYVDRLSENHSYPSLVQSYIVTQADAPAFLPPTRAAFLGAACLLKTVTGQASLDAIHTVSLIFGILAVFAATAFAWRAGGLRPACGVLALMSVAPLQVHLAHRALIDGFFACWTFLCLWTLWESLRQPRAKAWLYCYAFTLLVLVMTKENALFVFLAILAILIVNYWLRFGEVSSSLFVATIAASGLAILLLIALSGSSEAFFHAYFINIQKTYTLAYAIRTGDGPWYRYLLDLFAVSPLVMLLACATLFQTRREQTAQCFLVIFLLVTYAVMANLRYGMNLRYGAIWDLTLRWLAFAQIAALAFRFPERFRSFVVPAILVLVCAADLRQYFILFVNGAIYDPVPAELLRAVRILK